MKLRWDFCSDTSFKAVVISLVDERFQPTRLEFDNDLAVRPSRVSLDELSPDFNFVHKSAVVSGCIFETIFGVWQFHPNVKVPAVAGFDVVDFTPALILPTNHSRHIGLAFDE